MVDRRAGILLHVASLPGEGPCGDLGCFVAHFFDWCVNAGFSAWQVLPLSLAAPGESPYTAPSAFAGNEWLLCGDLARNDGLLPDDGGDPGDRETLAARSLAHVRRNAPRDLRRELDAFRDDRESRFWLHDWAVFRAIGRSIGQPWWLWPTDLRDRDPGALRRARQSLRADIDVAVHAQFLFHRQWERTRAAAANRGIVIVGDLPIYVAADSADVWAHRELFALGDDLTASLLAGVPPDVFSADGQLWGNPVYRWDACAAEDYRWWTARLRLAAKRADIVRLDHFRGFAASWEVPAGARSARFGRWRPGPGTALFRAYAPEGESLPFLAEDLGTITPDVEELRQALGIPGMKVLQFALVDPLEPDPIGAAADRFLYTGTHDNDTFEGWFAALSETDRALASGRLGGSDDVSRRALTLAFSTGAEAVVAPAADLARLGSHARVNTPGRVGGNWSWRAPRDLFSPELAAEMRGLISGSRRLPPDRSRPRMAAP